MKSDRKPAALVLLNPAAHGGRARALWSRVSTVATRHIDPLLVEAGSGESLQATVKQAVAEGIRVYIAAGGDGTVNMLLNALMQSRNGHDLGDFTVGSVGLGSSNDFHKPNNTVISGIPVKTDPRAAAKRDVCLARYTAADGSRHERHFIVSASMGATAEANAFFNTGNRIQRWLKAQCTQMAICYAALRTILRYRNIPARLNIDGKHLEVDMINLSVLKTPYLCGSFRFDTPVSSDDGLLAVNLCAGLGKPATLAAFANLARGRFKGLPGRKHWQASSLTVYPECPAALELDGEVCTIKKVEFRVLEERICECR